MPAHLLRFANARLLNYTFRMYGILPYTEEYHEFCSPS